MSNKINRRGFLAGVGATGAGAIAAGGTLAAPPAQAAKKEKKGKKQFQEGISPWALSLNTSTIRPASLEDKIAIAAEVGFDAIEPWIDDIENYEKAGGDLKVLGKQITDLGLYVPNVIGLWDCMPPAEEAFEASLEKTRDRMRMCSLIGSQRVAAIPAPDRADFDVPWGSECYRRLLEIGKQEYDGLIVAFEFIGFFKGIYRLGLASGMAMDTNDRDACLIADTFHLACGGSGFNGIRHLDGNFIGNFHWNDLPAEPTHREARDHDRIYPGDGVLPLEQCLRDLKTIGYKRALSLEMFNRAHWEQDPRVVAKTGIQKMRDNIIASGV